MLRSSSICLSVIYKYLRTDIKCNDENGKPLDSRCKKIRCLSDTLESYGGVLGKVSQMLSFDDQNSTCFAECKPFSKGKTIDYFKKFIKDSELPLDSVDLNVFMSGSIGQVHMASYKGKDIVFKVQYVGLADRTKTDLKMLDSITGYLYYFSDMKNAISDIRTQMFDELDYKKEAANQERMFDIYKDSETVHIPEIIPELSTDKVLGMYYVEGRCLKDFIENSIQEERNKFGLCAIKFVFQTIYKHGILYSDLHYGNLLVKKDSTMCVLDFDCLLDINDTLLNNLRDLHRSIRSEDPFKFYKIVEDMGIIKNDISEKSKKYIYDYFRIQYSPWTTEWFEFTEEWLDMATDKETELMKEWTLPQDMVYFNKIPYGMMHVLTKLKLKGAFRKVFDKMFEEII